MPERSDSNRFVQGISKASAALNLLNERLCGLLVAAMVAIVWFGVFSRYLIDLGGGWTEELARYVMIWAALLAIPVGVYRCEHIGVELLLGGLRPGLQRALRVVLALIAAGFFGLLAYYGVVMTVEGAGQYATIFGMTMELPFAAVPTAASVALLQTLAVLLRDLTGGAASLVEADNAMENLA